MHRKFLLGGFALAAAFGAGVAFSPKFVSA